MIKVFKRGFTLIELLVVIAIISILVAVGTSSYQKTVKISRDSKRKADLEQVRQALETYRSELGRYPGAADGNLNALDPDYIQTLPSDPKGYTYYYNRPTTTTYSLCAALELTPASPSCTTSSCGTGGNCNYGTANP